jgi:hypothetical protein
MKSAAKTASKALRINLSVCQRHPTFGSVLHHHAQRTKQSGVAAQNFAGAVAQVSQMFGSGYARP